MITSVKIKNFVIVDELEIDFQNGLIALTGETGAGKSLLVGAIDSVFGGKIKPGSLFNKAKPANIEVTVTLEKNNLKLQQLIKENEIEPENNEIFFSKEINQDLKSRYFLNGRRISRKLISEFRELLLDFHSQRDQQKLFDNNYQLDVLDAFAELLKLRQNYEDLYTKTLAKFNELKQLQEEEKRDQDRMKLYEFQLNEIKELQLKEDEDDKIQAELNLLLNSQDIIDNANLLEQQVYENEDSVYDILNTFLSRFRRFSDDDERIKNAVEHLKSSLVNIDDAVAEIQNLRDGISIDAARQEELENRLNEINRAKHKYKLDIPGLISYAEKIAGDRQNYSSSKEKIKKMQQQLSVAETELHKQADNLSQKRKKAALKLEEEIKYNIKALAIPQAEVKLLFNRIETGEKHLSGLNLTGRDEVEIMFSANAGIQVQPLKHAASGGELSRFLLVLKKILTDKLENRTIIFDEIDSGIGGKTANLLGEFISEISRYNQIFCITHLAQIAIYGKQHFSIVKENRSGKAKIIISLLNDEERKQEVARMLAGSDSKLALKYAEEIISKKES